MTEQVSDVEGLVAIMAIAIRDVSQGEGFDYMDFCQNAAAAAYAVVATKHAEDAKRIGELEGRLATARQYVAHRYNCASSTSFGKDCSCGLFTALNGANGNAK